MHLTTIQKVERFQFGGVLPKQCTTTSTRLPVMCGAMAVCSTRYGAWGSCHSKTTQTHRWRLMHTHSMYIVYLLDHKLIMSPYKDAMGADLLKSLVRWERQILSIFNGCSHK